MKLEFWNLKNEIEEASSILLVIFNRLILIKWKYLTNWLFWQLQLQLYTVVLLRCTVISSIGLWGIFFINMVILRSKKTPVRDVEFVAFLDGSLELDVERPARHDRADKDCTSVKGLERRYVTVSGLLVNVNLIQKILVHRKCKHHNSL